MTRKGRFKCDVFDCDIFITVSDNLLRSINTYFIKNEDGKLKYCPAGYFYRPGGDAIGTYHIFFDFNSLAVNIINHEKSHLVEEILTDRGIKPLDEVRSYLDGFISHKIDSFFTKRKIKIKNKR